MNWLINFIGILIYFINRYANRNKKTVAFNLKFWLKDNWPELSTTILIDIALMIILFSEGTEVNFDDLLAKLPFGLKLSGELLMSFLLGLGLAHLFYSMFKRKVSNAKG